MLFGLVPFDRGACGGVARVPQTMRLVFLASLGLPLASGRQGCAEPELFPYPPGSPLVQGQLSRGSPWWRPASPRLGGGLRATAPNGFLSSCFEVFKIYFIYLFF